jgi:hypothetical protein
VRWFEIINEAVDYDAYKAFGIEPQDADRFAKYPLSPDDVAFYIRLGGGVDGALKKIESERVRGVLRRAEGRAIDKLIAALPALRQSDRPVSYETACALIAADDGLIGFLRGWTWNADHAEENLDLSARFLAILKRIHPLVTKHLYRGQQPFRQERSNKRGFHSWSANRGTAENFAERTGVVLEINRPIQGVALEDILKWRMRMTDESHMSGPQAEWFVVDQPEQYS